jgi:hypothetical protein
MACTPFHLCACAGARLEPADQAPADEQYVGYRQESKEENSALVGAAWFLGNRGLAPW